MLHCRNAPPVIWDRAVAFTRARPLRRIACYHLVALENFASVEAPRPNTRDLFAVVFWRALQAATIEFHRRPSKKKFYPKEPLDTTQAKRA